MELFKVQNRITRYELAGTVVINYLLFCGKKYYFIIVMIWHTLFCIEDAIFSNNHFYVKLSLLCHCKLSLQLYFCECTRTIKIIVCFIE